MIRSAFLFSDAANASVEKAFGVGIDRNRNSSQLPSPIRLGELLNFCKQVSECSSHLFAEAFLFRLLARPYCKLFQPGVTATATGTWHWLSGSDPADSGLAQKQGSFVAVDWTEAEIRENLLRGGFLRATTNQHAFMYCLSFQEINNRLRQQSQSRRSMFELLMSGGPRFRAPRR